DFRKGIDGLAAVCRLNLAVDPFNGSLFLFYNRARTTLKLLAFDGQGFWLCTKRLSKGRYKYKLQQIPHSTYKKICYRSLQILFNNGDPTSAKFSKDWRPLRSN